MNDDTTCEIDNAPLQEQSVGMPCHVGKRTINHHEEEYNEHVTRKAYTLSKRTSDERRSDNGKLHLKQGVESQWNGCSTENLAGWGSIDITANIVEHQECGGIAYHATYVVAKAKRESEDYPQH